MFGMITVNAPELKVRELAEYRSYYCGVCNSLLERSGRIGQMTLSYDCTFLALLLTGLYEPEERRTEERCLRHPAVKHPVTRNRFTDYAADMNVLLAVMKAADDWKDEKKQLSRAEAVLLQKEYRKLKAEYPRQEEALRKNISLLSRAEKRSEGLDILSGPATWEEKKAEYLSALDRVSGYSGKFLGEMFAPEEDIFMQDLRECGFFLGKFIYLLDAYDDLETDEKKGQYNLLLPAFQTVGTEKADEEVYSLLTDLASRSCRAFERLPIVTHSEILRNVLYAGIWQTYLKVKKRRSGGGKKR